MVEVAEFIVHPEYIAIDHAEERFPSNAIALIKFAQKIQFSERVRPACLSASPAFVANPLLATLYEWPDPVLRVVAYAHLGSSCGLRLKYGLDENKQFCMADRNNHNFVSFYICFAQNSYL